MPADFAVAGSPVTNAGTLAVTRASQAANLFMASPSGASGAPTYRAFVAADFPAAVTGALQTPWLQNINAAGFTLANVPTVSGNGNITLAAGGAGALNLQTSAKTRVAIDGGGQAYIYGRDSDGTAVMFLSTAAGNSFLYSDGTGNVSLNCVKQATMAAQGNVLISAGPNSVTLQTSSHPRLSIDSAGHVVIAAPDDANPAVQLSGSGLQVISGASSIQLKSTATTYVSGAGTVFLQTNNGNRLSIDSAGHVVISAPDTAGSALQVSGSLDIPGGEFFNANVYWNGANYIYRKNGAAILMGADASAGWLYASAAGTAGATASIAGHMKFFGGAFTLANLPLAMILPATASGIEASMPNGSLVIAYASNTQVQLRFRGFDGVMRSATISVA